MTRLGQRLRLCADQSERGLNFADTPHACREAARLLDGFATARPLADYHEDMGPVLWWKLPVEEAPWCGQPHDCDWPGYHTHFTPFAALEHAPEPFRPEPDAFLYESNSMAIKDDARRPDLVERGYSETPLHYGVRPTPPELGFIDEAATPASAMRGSIHRSHRGEGFNYVD